MSSKEDNFKEQFKQALISTAKVISEDYKLDIKKLDKNLSNKKTDFFDMRKTSTATTSRTKRFTRRRTWRPLRLT